MHSTLLRRSHNTLAIVSHAAARSRMPSHLTSAGVSALAAGTGAAVGFLIGRQRGLSSAGASEVRALVGRNVSWMSPQDVALASALLATGRRHLLTGWPAPGIRDAQKRNLLQTAASGLSSAVSGAQVEEQRLELLVAPLAAKQPKELTTHGDTRIDEYYWLRDDDRKDPKVLAHLTAENTYTEAVMADTKELQDQLYKEMRGRIKEEDQGVPERLHGYYYYTRTEEGQQYKIHCRRAVPAGAAPPSEKDGLDLSVTEEIILDENKRKEEGGHTFYMVGAVEPSPNHKLLAFNEDTVGGEKYTLRVKDLTTGKDVMEPIPGTSGDVEWANDNNTLFYVVKDHLDRPYKVYRHVIGQPASSDVVVYEEKDESFYVGIGRSRSEKVIVISAGSAVTSETRYILADRPTDEFKVILPRVQDVEYSVSHRGQHFYITYRDASKPNSELRVAPMSDPTKHQVLLAHSREVKLEGVSLSEKYMAVFTRTEGLQRAYVYQLPADVNSAPQGPLDLSTADQVLFDEPAYEMGGAGTGDFESPVLRLRYSSLTTPASIIDYNMSTKARATKKVTPVLGGFDKSKYTTLRLWATAKDGVKVPISLVYRKDLAKLDGTDPLLLNGYGSYEISNDPYFSSSRLSLLDRGFTFAIAHIRGGGEMGRYWYEDGKFLKKRNTFDDYIACAEYLVANKYTNPSRLCIEGRSAGGLLMGAVVNQRPDLFNACIMGVPFVDCLTTMLDETIPLTIIEWEEWGNPADKAFYDYMKSYSPMDTIQSGVEYPHVLATGGLHDPRVGYWEPAKFVARLRASRPETAKRLLLLKMEMGAGHFSVTGRFEKLKQVAFEYAFLLKVQGMLAVKPAA